VTAVSCPRNGRLRPTVVVADDYPNIRAAISRLLENACDVVAELSDGAALVDAVLAWKPDVVVADVRLPSSSGLQACRHIRSALPRTKVILFSALDDEDLKRRALEAGASAFVMKTRAADDLLPAILNALDTRDP
jgi:DNA-binding NarL/FixJ family response regulator